MTIGLTNSSPDRIRLYLQAGAGETLARTRGMVKTGEYELVEFTHGSEIKLTTHLGSVGVVAFDFLLPDMTGTQLATWLEANRPSLVSLISVRATDARTAIRLASDTRAVVIPDTGEEAELWEALTSARHRALSGKSYQDAWLSLVRRIESCTDEELQILRHWARGKTNKQIAYEIGISMRTLNLRKSSILQKLEVENIVEAVWELSKYTEFDRFSFFPSRKMEVMAHSVGQPRRSISEPKWVSE